MVGVGAVVDVAARLKARRREQKGNNRYRFGEGGGCEGVCVCEWAEGDDVGNGEGDGSEGGRQRRIWEGE